MTLSVVREWPESEAEWDAAVARAEAKYGPLVGRLQPAELTGLINVVRVALADLRKEAHSEDIRRGVRPAGTSIGR